MARTSCLAVRSASCGHHDEKARRREGEGSEAQPALLGVEGKRGVVPGILQLSLAATFAFFLDSADAGAGADDADGKREIALFGFPNAITTLRDIQVQAGCRTSNPQKTTTLRGSSWALTIECHRRPPGLAI